MRSRQIVLSRWVFPFSILSTSSFVNSSSWNNKSHMSLASNSSEIFTMLGLIFGCSASEGLKSGEVKLRAREK